MAEMSGRTNDPGGLCLPSGTKSWLGATSGPQGVPNDLYAGKRTPWPVSDLSADNENAITYG